MTQICPARLLALPLLLAAIFLAASQASAADKDLLDVLFQNGLITQAQYDKLMQKSEVTSSDIFAGGVAGGSEQQLDTVAVAPTASRSSQTFDDPAVIDRIAQAVEDSLGVKASYGSKGFRLETRDGRFQTNLQWRAQNRFTWPYRSDPRQVSAIDGPSKSIFETRRMRMKIGGHGFQPWLKYYFEVDLQPTRDTEDGDFESSSRLIDHRIDIAKWDWATLRVGQWKVDLNRERVDSSGRQQFVERSIANRVFTIDRQMGVQLRGHLFKETPADMRYYVGAFTGEGRGNSNDDDSLMYMGRLQWNFMGRDLPWRQTDVEYTEKPTGSLAFAAMTNEGRCTRWSSSGCGRLDGYTAPALADDGQYEIEQFVQEFAFKYRGFSAQQEYHWKTIEDNGTNSESELNGGYAQVGYFFHHMFPSVPKQLELAMRYAIVEEPNAVDRSFDNEREEFTFGANWFMRGHNNKLTLDYSYLTIDDDFLGRDVSDGRVRLQWDVSF